ncbi:MAG TPA: VWA domain-containing protein [Terracidiphilus sp.]|nr:VWA domain-containing protein [Terracidiphilus sp.]
MFTAPAAIRALTALGLVAALGIPAAAARRVSVAQLEEALAADNAAHRSEPLVLHQISEFELTERLTLATLDSMARKFTLTPRTALALQLLADQSAFLDPPVDERPATALPDAAQQQHMLDEARGYAVRTWSRLPNFFVTRVTTRFDDSPQVLEKGGWPVREGFHPVGTAQRQVTFRNGREVQDTPAAQAATAKKGGQEIGLHTWGEFGPALTVVLADMAHGKVAFSHWEQTPTGLAAVFRYSVPKQASHYAVTYCCMLADANSHMVFTGMRNGRQSQINYSNMPVSTGVVDYRDTPPYEGEIAIDPGTGAVMRITLQAELGSEAPITRAATVVDYGPVTIGDRQFICPVRSLALSSETISPGGSSTLESAAMMRNGAWQSVNTGISHGPLQLLNETKFIDYHRLGTSVRILTDAADNGASPPQADDQSASVSVPAGSGVTPPLAASPALGPAQAETAAPHAQQIPMPAASSAPAATAANVAPPPPAAPVVPEITLGAATSLPDKPLNQSDDSEASFSLKVTTRLVDVGLVAYDKKGHPVNDLKADDFEIYDNGQKRPIRYFSSSAGAEQATNVTRSAAASAPEQQVFSNRTLTSERAAPNQRPQELGATVLLLDDSHIAWGDMNNARRQLIQFLGKLGPDERVGLYTMSSLGFHVVQGITTDHAALISRLEKWMPSAHSASQAHEEETRNRQQFDYVHNASDLNSVNGNHTDVPDAASPVDPQLLTMGSNPARASLVILAQVARHLAAVPGHKSVVWVSSDNVLADWTDQAVGIDKSPSSLDSYTLRAQEAMNDAHAAVYPFDVSQLEGGAITADRKNRNVELIPAAQDTLALAASATGGASQVPSTRDLNPGRAEAQMSQDLHPVRGSVREVAAGTGGRVIRRSGDLVDALNGIVADGHATYMLSFSPQGPADGRYHAITVKLKGRRKFKLRYRAGYLFVKEPETMKERFQQAVWRPTDVSEIAVQANPETTPSGSNLKINIATGDLGMEQQGGRWMDRLDIFFIQRDDAGLHAQIEGQRLGLWLKPSTYDRLLPIGIPFEHFVSLKPGMGSLRVLVVDENSGRMGSVTIPGTALEETR